VRYYCKDCKGTIILGEGTTHIKDVQFVCFICTVGRLVPFQDFETPEQHEKRTGKMLPYDAAVWWKYAGTQKKWRIIHLYSANKYKTEGELLIVCVNGPLPPPNDWRPS